MSENNGGPTGSFEERLRAARARRKMDAPPADTQGDSGGPVGANPWNVALRVGTELVSALAVGVAIGWGLDRWLHTSPIFLALFVLLGGAAGVLNVWRMLMPQQHGPGRN